MDFVRPIEGGPDTFLWSSIMGNTNASSSASASAPWVCSIMILIILIDFFIDHYFGVLRNPYVGA